MTRRLLRTITVTATVTESWTLVWGDTPGEPHIIYCCTSSVSRRSTSSAAVDQVAQEFAEEAASHTGNRDASQAVRPDLGPYGSTSVWNTKE